MRKGRSISRRMLAAAGLWSLVVLLLAGWSLLALYRAEINQRLDQDLNATMLTLLSAIDSDEQGELEFSEALLPNDQRFQRALSGWYWAFVTVDADNRILDARRYRSRSFYDTLPNIPQDLADAAIAGPETVHFRDLVGPDDVRLHAGVRAIRLPERAAPVLLFAGIDRTQADEAASRFAFRLTAGFLLLALGLAGAVVLMIRYGLRPLHDIQGKLGDVRSGRRDTLDGEYPAELYPLVREINTLISHNRKVVERARTQVGNLAHALKTPLAVLLNESRGDDRMSELVRRQVEAMSSNVNHYLKRAQAAAQAEVLGARTEVGPSIEGISRMLERLYRDKNIAIDVDSDPAAVFRGERGDLDDLIGNLLENAAKWCRANIRIRVARLESEVEVCVDDDGPGLAPELRKAALERGKRLDEATPGTGLGLSIVTELADIYAGRLSLEDSPMGGLRARLILPAAAL
jgi:signal transduction histidine kinase